jgi:hypothetical protein
MMYKDNKGLFKKKRVDALERENIEYLRSLTDEQCSEILENLTSAQMLNEFKDCFERDTPLCLKLALKK